MKQIIIALLLFSCGICMAIEASDPVGSAKYGKIMGAYTVVSQSQDNGAFKRTSPPFNALLFQQDSVLNPKGKRLKIIWIGHKQLKGVSEVMLQFQDPRTVLTITYKDPKDLTVIECTQNSKGKTVKKLTYKIKRKEAAN